MATLFDTLLDRFPYVQTANQEATLNAMLTVARRFLDRGVDLSESDAQKWIQYGVLLGADFAGANAAYQTWATEVYNAAQRGQRLPPSGAALASSSIFWDAQARRVYREVLNRDPSDQELAEAVNMLSRGAKSLLEFASDLQASLPVFEKASVLQTVDEFTQQAEQAALDIQASVIEAERIAVLDAGAFQADQDFLASQAKAEAEAAALAAQTAAAQAALDGQREQSLQAYALEVQADVIDVYRQVLKRDPQAFEVDYWSNLVWTGQIEGELVAVRLSQSTEGIILGAYQQNLYRNPTIEERRYWCDAVEVNGLPVDQAISYIANSEEAKSYHEAIVVTPGATPLIVQTINPMTGSAEAIDPIMGTSTWGASYTNQDMIAADPVASPVIELQNYFAPDVNISSLEAVSPLGDTSPALAFKARDEIYKAYTTSLKREPSEADYQYWEPLLVDKSLSVDDFKRYVATSEEAKALGNRAEAASLTTNPPEVVADLTKKSEGVGAAVGLLSALAFFLGQ